MKKKILSTMFVFCLIIFSSILFSACKQNNNNNNNNNNNPTTITVSFRSAYGSLSFYEKTLHLNEEGYIYLKENDCPVVTNEGDNRIFSCWLNTNNGQEFNFNMSLSEDISLTADFVDAEIVVKSKWQVNDSLITKQYSSLPASFGTNGSGGLGDLRYVKVKKSEAIANNYLLKSQLGDYYTACFVTSSNSIEKIITINDLTLDTYLFTAYIIISPNAYRIFSYGFYYYLPKGVKPLITEHSYLLEYIVTGLGASCRELSLKPISEIKCLTQNSQFLNSQQNIDVIRNFDLLSNKTNADFNSDYCYLFLEVSGFKYAINTNNGISYNYTLPGSGSLQKDVSEEIYNSIEY